MDEVEQLLGKAIAELEKLLDSKTVVGNPISVGETTLIPLVSIGFCFGAGGGSAVPPGQKEKGSGGGTGGGGGIKPIGVVIIDKQGTRVEAVKGGSAHIVEKIADIVARGMDKSRDKK